jgi:hypothetical protein
VEMGCMTPVPLATAPGADMKFGNQIPLLTPIMKRPPTKAAYRDEWSSWPNVRLGIETGPAPATARPEANVESNSECGGSSPKCKLGHSRFQRCPLLAHSGHAVRHAECLLLGHRFDTAEYPTKILDGTKLDLGPTRFREHVDQKSALRSAGASNIG